MARLQTFSKSTLLHGNIFSDTTKILSYSDVTDPAFMFDGVTTTKGEVTATGAIIEYDLTGQDNKTASGIGVAVHNGTDFTTCSISLEVFTGSWNVAATIDIVSNPAPTIVSFAESTFTKWRLVFTYTGGSTNLFIANISLAMSIDLPCGMQTGFNSPRYADNDDVNYNRALGGQLAGINSKKRGVDLTIPVNYMTETWARTNALNITNNLKLYPFYFRWDSVNALNSTDTFFGWLKNSVPKPVWSSRQFLSMTIDANGIADNG